MCCSVTHDKNNDNLIPNAIHLSSKWILNNVLYVPLQLALPQHILDASVSASLNDSMLAVQNAGSSFGSMVKQLLHLLDEKGTRWCRNV